MSFKDFFKKDKEFSIEASGRVEIGGNHTDHQGGCVFAGAINLTCRADVARRNDSLVKIYSSGFGEISVDLNKLNYIKDEEGTSKALVKGIAKKFFELDSKKLFGFDAYIESDVMVGSGLSSSAAFEILIARIFDRLGEYNVSSIDMAKFSHYAENKYYGKPSGLMDQMACSVGGLCFIDFRNKDNPVIEKTEFNLSQFGYSLCVIDTGAEHSSLTHEYAAIPMEMKQVASCFGKDILSELDEKAFYSDLGKLREKVSDRALLRAAHYFAETKRAREEFDAAKNGDIKGLLKLIKDSGRSSFEYLQNVIPSGSIKHQDMALVMHMCEKIIGDDGVVRVHGGGFAGTLLAFVPDCKLEELKNTLNDFLGFDPVHVLDFYK